MLIGNKRLWGVLTLWHTSPKSAFSARLAQSVERKALNLVVVGSSPTVGAVVQKHKNLMQNLPCLDWNQ